MTGQHYCRRCGEAITFCWETKGGDRDEPDYYHWGCLHEGETYEPSVAPELPGEEDSGDFSGLC